MRRLVISLLAAGGCASLLGCGGGGAAASVPQPGGVGEREAPVVQEVSLIASGSGPLISTLDGGVPAIELQAEAKDNIDVTAYCALADAVTPKADNPCFTESKIWALPIGPAWQVWARDAAGNVSAGVTAPGPCSAQAQAASDASSLPTACFKTDLGEFVVELEVDKAPKSVANFQQYVRDGFYAGVLFHRIMSGFMVQTGGFVWNGGARTKKEATYEAIELEKTTDTGLSNTTGTVAMARQGDEVNGQPNPNGSTTATSEFFINVVDNKALDADGATAPGKGYAVFGRVIFGMDATVQNVRRAQVVANSLGELSSPVDNLFIQWAYLMKP